MAKIAYTLPAGYKKKDVFRATDQGVYMRDNTVWSLDGQSKLSDGETKPDEATPPPPAEPPVPTTVDPRDAEIAHLREQLAERDSKIDGLKAGKGNHEGVIRRQHGPYAVAGRYPQALDDMPTLDDINGTAKTYEDAAQPVNPGKKTK